LEISRKIKLALFDALNKEDELISLMPSDMKMKFLNSIWNLRTLPSTDSRFTNAYDDVHKHIVMNDDWTTEELFFDYLKLLDNDAIYVKYLENIVNPEYRKNRDDIKKCVLLVNSYIEDEGLVLYALTNNNESMPIYTVMDKKDINDIMDQPQNITSFYVTTGNHIDTSSKAMPFFILDFNNGWNDFGHKTEFTLTYHKQDSIVSIGQIKITNSEETSISESLPDSFTELDDNFCSLGQSYEFYKKLKEVAGESFERILFALKDAAFHTDIHDKFEQNESFKTSLIRNDTAEQLLRSVKYRIYGFDLNNLYSFKYNFLPKYSKEPVDIEFNFNNNKDLPNRIYGIIGKNGTGKTQLITSLPLDISNNKSNNFIPQTPLFSKVIAVSYSIFDNFEIPKKTATFNYKYCGLQNEKGSVLTERQQLLRFHKACQDITEKSRISKWRGILSSFINNDTLNKFVVADEDILGQPNYSVDREAFNKIRKTFSSGQNILIYIITEIISNIRRDSLLLFDEPETHLHPNAIYQLMDMIYELVHEFQSYCIITTHSPLIVQELLSKNVHIIDKHENVISVRKPSVESFGQNLTTLTEEIFGNNGIEKRYKKIINKMVLTGKDYDKIVSILETEGVPLSINARLYIKSQVI
jgi:ABC-type cobalamin/Fe3+-siderophores transport system ATPase subunit